MINGSANSGLLGVRPALGSSQRRPSFAQTVEWPTEERRGRWPHARSSSRRSR